MKLFLNDTETTGLSHLKQDIIQIGGLITENFKKITEINLKCQPVQWDNINAYALKVNKTTKAQLKKYPDPKDTWKTYYEVVEKYYDGKKYVFAGQNAPFDKRFLRHWWSLHKIKGAPDFDEFFEEKDLDLKDLTTALKKYGFIKVPNVKLETIIEAMNISVPEEGLHDALGDIKATGNGIYKSLKMIENIHKNNPSHVIGTKFERWLELLQ